MSLEHDDAENPGDDGKPRERSDPRCSAPHAAFAWAPDCSSRSGSDLNAVFDLLHPVHIECVGRRSVDDGAGRDVEPEPWHWHMIVVPVSRPADSGQACSAQVQRSSNA